MVIRQIFSMLLLLVCVQSGAGCASSRPAAAKNPTPPPSIVDLKEDVPALDPLERGYALEAAQLWPEAVAFYAHVLKEQPANATALHRLGVIATLRDDHDAAAGYYRRAMELDPRNAELLADTGYFLMLRKQYDAASLMLQQAQLLDPDNERVINNLATVQGLRGDIDAALALFRRVNSPAVALQNVAALHEQRGEWQLALACYLEAQLVDSTVTVPDDVRAKVAEVRQGQPPSEPEATVANNAVAESQDASTSAAVPPRSRPLGLRSSPAKPSSESTPPTPGTSQEEQAFFPEEAAATVAVEADSELETLVDADWDPNERPVEATGHTELVAPSTESLRKTLPREAALNGCCPVALRDVAQVIDGRPEFIVDHQGVLYVLSSADALRRFREQPERYVPSAGGLDVVAVRSGRMERGSLHFSTWFRNRLYLFTSPEHVDEFRSDPLRYVNLD